MILVVTFDVIVFILAVDEFAFSFAFIVDGGVDVDVGGRVAVGVKLVGGRRRFCDSSSPSLCRVGRWPLVVGKSVRLSAVPFNATQRHVG